MGQLWSYIMALNILQRSVQNPASGCGVWWGWATGIPSTEHSLPRPQLLQPTELADKPGPEAPAVGADPNTAPPGERPHQLAETIALEVTPQPLTSACFPTYCPLEGLALLGSLASTPMIPSHKHTGHGQMSP